MDYELTQGSLQKLNEGDDNAEHQPILQVLSVKKVQSNSTNDRYRLIVSDGDYFMQAMLATNQNELVTSDPPQVEKNTIIKLAEYAVNVIQGRRVIICLAVEPLSSPPDKIGNPISIDNAILSSSSNNHPAGGPDVQMADPEPVAKADTKPKVNAGKGGMGKKTTGSGGGAGGAGGRSNAGMTMNGAPIYPIEGLSPYQNKWTIKARVVSKSEIKHWSNARGDGKLFSVNLLDESGEIKATGFNDACDTLYPILEEGKVYFITKARVNIAKKQFSNLTNEYEIAFEKNTEVSLCPDQDSSPQIKYDFTQLSDLNSLEKDATCDILGIVQSNGDLSEITSKATQKQIKKRELTIVDQSGYSVRMTLWGRSAETWVDSDRGVFAFKGARVGDFGGRTLSMGGQSTMAPDPDIPEAHALKGWYDTEGTSTSFATYSSSGGGAAGSNTFKKDEFKTLQQVKDEDVGMHSEEKPEYFSSRATVVVIRSENLSYPACPTDKCNKKMSMESDDSWRCEKCDTTYQRPEYRYVLSLCVSDHTGQLWLSGFNDTGLLILGKTADEMQQLKEDDEGAYNATIQAACGKMWNFGVRAKAETYQDQTRARYHVTKAVKVNWVETANQLLDDIIAFG